MQNLFETVVLRSVGITAEHPLAGAISGRDKIMDLTQKSHDAVLRPRECGGLSHAVRAALACRIAKHNSESVLADHFQGMIGSGDGAQAASRIADVTFDGADDSWLKAILAYADLVTVMPKNADAPDIEKLQSAGLPDADIVRLSELVAFVSYQIRLVAGLRLMAEVA